ncbi:Os02g0276601 [Oryza sativa Japonica Group]|uniref:Os02g0276601 protein n=1 Tax=Oryza sativa subsp. japonica TaxID=39947 RepID=A0A0P0VHJ5_ORYSJ|nr:Os02g0276601 [Oryza sativa Japonica Group]
MPPNAHLCTPSSSSSSQESGRRPKPRPPHQRATVYPISVYCSIGRRTIVCPPLRPKLLRSHLPASSNARPAKPVVDPLAIEQPTPMVVHPTPGWHSPLATNNDDCHIVTAIVRCPRVQQATATPQSNPSSE